MREARRADEAVSANVAVLIPVLGRPQNVRPIVESIRASATLVPCTAVFLCSPLDDAEIAAVQDAGEAAVVVPWENGPGDYAKKINHGFKLSIKTGHVFCLLGADDLVFHPGWIERAAARYFETGACVIGTNDLGNPRVLKGVHSTHPLVHRDYLDCGTVDEKGKILHEGYGHWFVDDEFIATAQRRGTYAHAADSIVEHLHPNWRKAPDDGTYRKGQATLESDRRLYQARQQLWA